jgi:hypothetical protein
MGVECISPRMKLDFVGAVGEIELSVATNAVDVVEKAPLRSTQKNQFISKLEW